MAMHLRRIIIRYKNTHTKSTPNKKNNQSSHDRLESSRYRLPRVGRFTSNHRNILGPAYTEASSIDSIDE